MTQAQRSADETAGDRSLTDTGNHPFGRRHRPLYESRHWGVLLNRDQTYLGRSIVYVRNRTVDDPLDLTAEERDELWDDVMPRLVGAIDEAFAPDRMNYTHLANRFHLVHWHVVPRYEIDPNREFAGHVFHDPRVGKNYTLSRRKRRVLRRSVPAQVVDAVASRLSALMAD